MVLYRKSKSVVFLLWTISVFLLCAGSLINFHQNKIWGKPLNFELVAVKREAKTIVKINQDENGSHGDQSMEAVIIPQNQFAGIILCTGTFRFGELCPAGQSLTPLTTVLRGPPAVL